MAPSLSLVSKILIKLISGYQLIVSPLIGSRCRFQPTCSQYGIEAIHRFDILKGSWLILKRILKCHPLNSGGQDPVPQKTLATENIKKWTHNAIFLLVLFYLYLL